MFSNENKMTVFLSYQCVSNLSIKIVHYQIFTALFSIYNYLIQKINTKKFLYVTNNFMQLQYHQALLLKTCNKFILQFCQKIKKKFLSYLSDSEFFFSQDIKLNLSHENIIITIQIMINIILISLLNNLVSGH